MLILVRGMPGSGKTTIAAQLAADKGYLHLEPDQYHERLGGFMPENITAAGEWCRTAAQAALGDGRDVVVANQFANLASLLPYIIDAKSMGHPVQVIRATGAFKSSYNVAPASMMRRARSWEHIPWETTRMPVLPAKEEHGSDGHQAA